MLTSDRRKTKVLESLHTTPKVNRQSLIMRNHLHQPRILSNLRKSDEGEESFSLPTERAKIKIQQSQASIWPFGGGSSHKSADSSKREVQSQSSDVSKSPESSPASVPSQPSASMSQQFHYFWNHDKLEPKLVAQEASKILADAQLQTNHKAIQALSGTRRSSDDSPKGEMATSGVETTASGSSLSPVAALIPNALQQQLTALVLQMQRQLQQQTSLFAQPRLDMHNRFVRHVPVPLAPTNRLWPAHLAPVMSPEMMAAESMQLSSNSLMLPLRTTDTIQPMAQLALPGLATVPIYGPYTIQPAAGLIQPNMVRARSMNFAVPQQQLRPAANTAYGSKTTSRRKSWPFYPFTDRIPFFMNSAASQPKVTVVGPPTSSTLSQRSSPNQFPPQTLLNNLEKQTLLVETSNQLAAAISSHLQARAAQQKLVSLLSQVIEQPQKHQGQDLIGTSSLINARFAQPEQSDNVANRVPYLLSNGLVNKPSTIGFSSSSQPYAANSLNILDSSINNNSFSAYGNRVNKRQLDSAISETYLIDSPNQQEDLLKGPKSGDNLGLDKVDSTIPDQHDGSTNGRVKRSAAWTPSGFSPIGSQVTLAPNTAPKSSIWTSRQARVLRASPLTSLTSAVSSSPYLLRRNLSNVTALNSEQVTTVSSLQIPDLPLDWSTPTKRADFFKAAKVKRVVSSGSVFHHSIVSPAKADSRETASLFASDPSKFSAQDSALHSGPLQPMTSAIKSSDDIMSGSVAESTRVINYFQNVDSDKTTTKAPEPASDTSRPILSVQSNTESSVSANRYKSSKKSILANETSDNNSISGSRYISGRGNGLQGPSGANYVPHQSSSSGGRIQSRQQVPFVGNNAATADISSSATRSVAYSITNGGPSSVDSTVSKPGLLETSSSRIGSGNHALDDSITRTSSSTSSHQMDSSLSDLDAQDMQVKLLDSLLAKENSARSSSSSYVTTRPPQMQQHHSHQTGTGNDRSPSADQSGSYNEEMLPPSFASPAGNDQSFQDALDQSSQMSADINEMNQQDLKHSTQDYGLSQMTESNRQHPSVRQSLVPVQSQQNYNMTLGEWVSGPSAITAEQPMDISSNSMSNLNQLSTVYPEEQSQFMNYPTASPNPLVYQPSIQRQLYIQQLQALGSAVNRYNQNRFTYPQSSFAPTKNLQVQLSKDMYAPMLRNDFNHLNWANLDDSPPHQTALSSQSISYGNQNVANMISFPGNVGGPNVNDARNYLMAGSEQSRSEQGDDIGSSKTKRTKSKPIKQVSHHYHINNFGFPMEDVDNPLEIAAAYATNPGLGFPRTQQKPAKTTKNPKEDEKQNEEEEEEEKPKRKKFLRRFSFKNLFKKLKKDKKKENVEGSGEETGNGGGEESSEERKSKLY